MTWNDIITADDLWEAACCHFPVVSPEGQRSGLVLLRELAKGEPVTTAQLARALGTLVEAAEALTTGSALSPFVHKDEEGRIQGFYGLSVTPTHHQLTIQWTQIVGVVRTRHPGVPGTPACNRHDRNAGSRDGRVGSPHGVVRPHRERGADCCRVVHTTPGSMGCLLGGPDHRDRLPFQLLLRFARNGRSLGGQASRDLPAAARRGLRVHQAPQRASLRRRTDATPGGCGVRGP